MDYSYFVFETPKDCFSCPFLICAKEHYCEVEDGGRLIEVNVCDGKPDWCPLRPLPKRYDEGQMREQKGWNACLDEITGDVE